MIELADSPKVAASMLDEDHRKWHEAYWYALYTRSRHEKFIRGELEKKGIETFLPLKRVTRRWSDRKKVIEEPLFKGYLFVHTPLINRISILNTKGAVRFVGPSVSPLQVSETELASIRHFMENELPMDPFPYLKEGERVYIRSGPMKGVEGFIVRKDKHCRLVISLDLLMQSVSVLVDQAIVEKL
ncbi:MAG: UpxY family transcription antiterminator [Candidatus Omnitrophica bacterium]|nr:UpxY family transcription antiterminator [Candidatus Omnitrophota bacterium]